MMDWGSGGEWDNLVMIDQKVAAAVTTKKSLKVHLNSAEL